MPKRRATEPARVLPPLKPALTAESREGQLIALAMDRVEDRIRNNQASSQELVHFLKLASEKEKLEREKLENECIMLQAKVKALEAQTRNEELFQQVMTVMKKYSGYGDEDDDVDFTDQKEY